MFSHNLLSGIHILLVEDVEVMRMSLRMVLNRLGAKVTEAEDLKQSLKVLHQHKARLDFILLDLELPDGNGLALMREVPLETLVIALSADQSRETELRCLAAGCVALLSKNSNFTELRHFLPDTNGHAALVSEATVSETDLADKYVQFLVQSRYQLQKASANSDPKTAYTISHRLCGTAIHFGYTSIGASAHLLMKALKTKPQSESNTAMQMLCTRIGEAIKSHNSFTNQN